MSDLSTSGLYKELKEAKSKVRTLGIVMIVLGIFCCIFSPFVSASITVVIGIMLTIAGVFQGFQSFSFGWGFGKILNILFSLLMIWAGLFMVFHPVLGTITLIQVAMIYFLIGGIFEIFSSFRLKPRKDWWVTLVMGLINIIFAAILFNRTDIAVWLLGLLIGLNLTLKGMILLTLSSTD